MVSIGQVNCRFGTMSKIFERPLTPKVSTSGSFSFLPFLSSTNPLSNSLTKCSCSAGFLIVNVQIFHFPHTMFADEVDNHENSSEADLVRTLIVFNILYFRNLRSIVIKNGIPRNFSFAIPQSTEKYIIE